MDYNWYSLGDYNSTQCGNCNSKIENAHAVDHHSGICPECKIQCIWFDIGKNKVLQIIPDKASKEFKKFIEWAQLELDELEFVELISSFEELGELVR